MCARALIRTKQKYILQISQTLPLLDHRHWNKWLFFCLWINRIYYRMFVSFVWALTNDHVVVVVVFRLHAPGICVDLLQHSINKQIHKCMIDHRFIISINSQHMFSKVNYFVTSFILSLLLWFRSSRNLYPKHTCNEQLWNEPEIYRFVR